MAHKKIKLAPRKQKWAETFKPGVLRGGVLRPSASTEAQFQQAILKQVDDMVRDTKREVLALYTEQAPVVTTDASIASQARILMNSLADRFQLLFNAVATTATKRMVDRTLKNSATAMKTSLKEITGALTLPTDILTGELREVVTASVAESVNLIKRVPSQFLDQVQGEVMRSITTGNGLQDLIPAMEKHGVEIRNWAKNTSLDQTRKVFNSINKGRMEAVGMKKFQWVHSGGSNKPRPLHKNVLNGQIFSFDDLPIIDERSGERGIPGQAINCHCVMRPIFSFDE